MGEIVIREKTVQEFIASDGRKFENNYNAVIYQEKIDFRNTKEILIDKNTRNILDMAVEEDKGIILEIHARNYDECEYILLDEKNPLHIAALNLFEKMISNEFMEFKYKDCVFTYAYGNDDGYMYSQFNISKVGSILELK